MHNKEIKEPDSGDVFTMTNGERVRVEYDRIFIYKSSQKASNTVIELGYAPDTETLVLDISFDEFDNKYQANRKAWKEYWKANPHTPY